MAAGEGGGICGGGGGGGITGIALVFPSTGVPNRNFFVSTAKLFPF